jgi:nitrite reductase (cytochrome c-552)
MPWADVVARIRTDWPETIDYGAGCNHCHDPHDGKFRLIRKGVIAAILARGTDPYSKSRNVIPASEDQLSDLMNARGADGELTAQARRLAGILTCAQCHIEYVCGQGADRATTGEIRDDVPWRKLADIEAYYQTKFGNQQDWKHSITGLTGVKPQHPETEEYWGSVHYRLDMSCADCHMAKSASASGAYTSHWLTSPLKNNTAMCGKCHEDVQAELFAVQDAFYAEARVVEDLLNTALQKIEAANTSGLVPAGDLATAKSLFMSALTWWEWTAVSENSMGSHYPDQAREQMQYAKDKVNEALLLLP